jgi:diguanylate cyclase (GGDEF)-like protein
VLRVYVALVIAASAAAIGTATALTPWRARDAVLFGLLMVFGAAVIEFTRRITVPAGLIKEVHGAWQLPMALLLPPVYCLIAPVVTIGLLQLRTRRTIPHRRVFTAAANGLSLGAASITFHALPAMRSPWLWLLAVVGCALLWSAVNKALVMTAVRGSDPTVSVREQLFTPGPLLNDACEIGAAVVLAGVVVGAGLILLIPALPLVVVLQRSFRQAQLLSRARLDSDTGLLNAAAWRTEAEVQISRAQQAKSPIALGIIDLDHFQMVNDALGWEGGDDVLAEVATTLAAVLRSSDLIGRFGGEEFVVLLPGADTGEALRVAERLRSSIAAQPISAGPGSPHVHVTVSIGLAAVKDLGNRDLTDLLTAADAALYRAKHAGRDRVRLAPGSTPQRDADVSGTADQQPSGEGSASEREEITVARRELGRQQAYWRRRAKMTQQQLAERAGYSRSTVSSAEAGEPVSAIYWAAVDKATGAGGRLLAQHARIEAVVTAIRQRAARQAWVRTEGVSGEMSGELPKDRAAVVTDFVCPRCDLPLTVSGSLHITAVIPENPAVSPVDQQPS